MRNKDFLIWKIGLYYKRLKSWLLEIEQDDE